MKEDSFWHAQKSRILFTNLKIFLERLNVIDKPTFLELVHTISENKNLAERIKEWKRQRDSNPF